MNSDPSAETPLLSIVVPTKNRTDVAVRSLEALSAIQASDLEIIVQDGSDTDALQQKLAPLLETDGRIQYFYGGPAERMADNWNRAVPHTRGRYLMFIGDDDGVDDRIMDWTRWAHNTDIEAACGAYSKYYWHDVGNPYFAGRVFVQEGHTAEVSFHDSRSDAIDRLQRGELGSINLLPKIYHGIVKRELVEAIREKAGVYFDSGSPDWFCTWALAPKVRRLAYIDYPLTVDGKCHISSSGQKMDRKTRERFLTHNASVPFSTFVPKTRRPGTLQHKLDSVFRALTKTGESELLDHFNAAHWYAACAAEVPTQSLEVLRHFVLSMRGRAPAESIRKLVQFFGDFGQLGIKKLRVGFAGRMRGPTLPNAQSSFAFRPYSAKTMGEALAVQRDVLQKEGVLDRFVSNIQASVV